MRAASVSFATTLGLLGLLGCPPNHADAATLHGCVANNCTENAYGVVSIANPTLPNFEFTSSPGGASGTLFIDILIPDDVSGGNSLTFSITDGTASPDAASLISSTPWINGSLASYLKISASPNNPIGNYDSLSGRAPPVNGFYVYQVDLGTNTLEGNSDPKGSPQLSLTGDLPEDSYLLAFLETTTGKGKNSSTHYSATANSGAIFEDTPPVVTPLPASLPLFAAGFGVISLLGWRRKQKALVDRI